MRWRLIAALALLSVVFVGAAPGLAAEHEDESNCVPDCEIQVSTIQFNPAVTVVETGSTVHWFAFDVYHTATSDPAGDDGPCLDVEVWPGDDSLAQFDIVDGQLIARQVDANDEWTDWQVCDEAVGQANGGFLLAYHCEIHEDTRAALLVVPSLE